MLVPSGIVQVTRSPGRRLRLMEVEEAMAPPAVQSAVQFDLKCRAVPPRGAARPAYFQARSHPPPTTGHGRDGDPARCRPGRHGVGACRAEDQELRGLATGEGSTRGQQPLPHRAVFVVAAARPKSASEAAFRDRPHEATLAARHLTPSPFGASGFESRLRHLQPTQEHSGGPHGELTESSTNEIRRANVCRPALLRTHRYSSGSV
jgi:hypothetical protein